MILPRISNSHISIAILIFTLVTSTSQVNIVKPKVTTKRPNDLSAQKTATYTSAHATMTAGVDASCWLDPHNPQSCQQDSLRCYGYLHRINSSGEYNMKLNIIFMLSFCMAPILYCLGMSLLYG